MEVGLIGLGKMGTGIAKSLLRAGHGVTVFNRTRPRAEALRADGANVAESVAEACLGEAVLTMVADDAALEAVVTGAGGILASLHRGGIHVSVSTISTALSDRLAAEHSKAGQEFVAAPVFGRPEAAEGAKLAVVAAGPASSVQRCKPLFEAMGPKLFVVGERSSMANVVKLSGNFLIATVLESLAEALTFARKSGVDPGLLLEFLTTTMFTGPVYKTLGDLASRLEAAGIPYALIGALALGEHGLDRMTVDVAEYAFLAAGLYFWRRGSWVGCWIAGAAALWLSIVVLNFRFYRFLREKRGIRFAADIAYVP